MVISFGHTDALLAEQKTVTRREWTNGHAKMFREGQLVDAYDKSPRGRKVATIRITRGPYRERLAEFPIQDVAGEGFAWMARTGREMPPVPWLTAEAALAWRGYQVALGRYFDNALLVTEAELAFCRAMHRAIRHVVGGVWVVRFELVSVEEVTPND